MERPALNFKIKKYEFLTKDELYAILRLRAEVFVVEQDCVYQDVDNKDQNAVHVLGYLDDTLVAYTRFFEPGKYFNFASIGRVVVQKEYRKYSYGYEVMKQSIEGVRHYFNETTIKISAQTYLKRFYNNLGFKEIGEEYLEDGIPHVAMIRKE